MQAITLSHQQQSRSGLKLSGAIKFIIPTLLITVAVFELTPAHLVILALVSVMVLLVIHNIDKVNSIDVDDRKQIVGGADFDGGSFHKHRPQPVKSAARSVIRDGGSFERAPLFPRKA